MSRKRPTRIDDPDNPEWTKADFARAKPPEKALSPTVLAAFKHHRGPQKDPTKIPVSIRLSRDVVRYFKAGGPGWQSRIDDALQAFATRSTRRRKSTAKRKNKAA
jgi:uncharacterized protein (DUF4415 family)